jgi:hypothetical protein
MKILGGEGKKLGWVREDGFLGMRRKMMKFTLWVSSQMVNKRR